jgi:hypothetical protein
MNPTPIRSVTSGRFWDLFDALPRDIQDLARAAYDLFHENPSHPGLQFKLVLPRRKFIRPELEFITVFWESSRMTWSSGFGLVLMTNTTSC